VGDDHPLIPAEWEGHQLRLTHSLQQSTWWFFAKTKGDFNDIPAANVGNSSSKKIGVNMIFSDFSQSNIGISQQESMKWGFDKINGGFHQQRDFTLFLKESTRGSTKGGQKKSV
jgi:hypothetical protein